ncbi:hypothetical protein AB4Z46_26955 [Variovorax sp. M-6]|uniref:hypothetical protein n=1 Tax=Variovorax sp. M-6 TaxID=3233041 RepID=UPI003F9C686D
MAKSFRDADASGWKALGIALATVATLMLLLCWISTPRWQTNDDVSMSMVAHGYGVAAGGSPPYLMFSNVLWGYLVRGLPTLQGVPGYSLATMASLLVAGSAIGYGLLRMRVSYAACAAVLGLVMARPILFPQFTVNAGLLMVASVILLCLYAREGKTGVMVAACLLAIASYLIRAPEFFFVCAVGWTFLPIRQLLRDRAALVGAVAVGCVIAVAAMVDHQAYKAPEWRDFNALNHVRALLTDFGAGEPLRKHPDVLEKHGFSENDLKLMEHWFFVDPNLANPPVLEAMLSEVDPQSKQESRWANAIKGLKFLGHPSLWMLALVALGVSVVRPSRAMLAAWTIFVAAIAAIGYLGRPGIVQIYSPLLALLLLAPLALNGKRQRYDTLLALALGVASLVHVLDVLEESRALKAADIEVRERVSGVDGIPVVVWGDSFPFEAVYSVLGTSERAMNYRFYGLGVSTLAPFAVARSESRAGRGLLVRLRSPEGVPIFANSVLLSMLKTYCSEHFDGRFESVGTPPKGSIAPTWYRCSP